jgi:cysteine desulfurase family protein (TIGR01976 family)
MTVMSFDVARVRGLYPTVGAGTAHLDGSFSALQPESVIRAIIATLRSSPSQPGSRSERSQRATRSVLSARRAVGDLIGVPGESVVLAHSTAELLLLFADLMSRDWQLGDEVVLSRMDTDVNVRAWLRAARSSGGVARWAEVDLETGELPTWQYAQLINEHTRVVTVPLANPATGAVPNVRAIADLAHAYGALVVVDAGAAIPHLALDLTDLGADLLVISAATFGGPTVAAAAAAPGLLEQLDGDNRTGLPQHFEFGPTSVELLDGLVAAIDHLADLDEWASGTRRERIIASLTAAGDYEQSLYERLDAGLRSVAGVTVLGSSDDRLPMAAFTVAGHIPQQVGDYLQRRGVSAWTGPCGLSELLAAYGADELGGATYVGLMPHTAAKDVDLLLNTLELLTA